MQVTNAPVHTFLSYDDGKIPPVLSLVIDWEIRREWRKVFESDKFHAYCCRGGNEQVLGKQM